MSSRMPMTVFIAVAFAIAAAAFGVAQAEPGYGMMVVLAASMIWVAFVVADQRQAGRDGARDGRDG